MNCMPDIPKILVGNKCDGLTAVPINEAQKFADTFNMPVSTVNMYILITLYHFWCCSCLKHQPNWTQNVTM